MRKRWLKDEYEELLADAARGKRPSETGWLRMNCPLCELRIGKGDRRQSLGLSVTSFRFECYRCGATGRLSKPIDEFAGFVSDVALQAPPPVIDPPEGFYPLGEGAGATASSLAAARDYLAGVDSEGGRPGRPKPIGPMLLRESGIGACVSGYWANRVVIPIFDLVGEWANYSTRILPDWEEGCEKKYLYPKGGRRNILYNHAALLEVTDIPVLVVEGCFDALAHWPHSVAVLGKPTPGHLEALASAQRPVVFVLDGDAWEEAWALTLKLRAKGQNAAWVKLAPGVDPDEIPGDVLMEACQAALAGYQENVG